jgi:hypothetical protein
MNIAAVLKLLLAYGQARSILMAAVKSCDHADMPFWVLPKNNYSCVFRNRNQMWTVRFTGDAVLNKTSICILQPNRDVHCRITDMIYFATFGARSQNCWKWLVAS